MGDLAACIGQSWQPRIGDPQMTGWATVLAYLVCCALAFRVWRAVRHQGGGAFWALLAGLLLFLAVNKQLDLQTALTALGRCMARAQGWYENRRIVQLAFIGGLLLVMAAALLWVGRRMRGHLRRDGLALTGLAILCGYVAVRAVGFHHLDALIGHRRMGISTNYLFENAGLLLIAVNAILILGRGRPRRGQQARRPTGV